MISIDIDKYEGDIRKFRKLIEEIPFTLATFLCVSGIGLSIISEKGRKMAPMALWHLKWQQKAVDPDKKQKNRKE